MTRAALHIVRDEEPRQIRGLPIRRTEKRDGDYVCTNPALVAWKARKEVA